MKLQRFRLCLFAFCASMLILAGCQKEEVTTTPTQSPQTNTTGTSGYQVSGKVSLEDGSDPSGTVVSLKETGQYGVADSSGNFTIEAVPTGNYSLSFARSGYTQDQTVSLSVDQKDTLVKADFRLQPKGNIFGVPNVRTTLAANKLTGAMQINLGDLVPSAKTGYSSVRAATQTGQVEFDAVTDPKTGVILVTVLFNGKTAEFSMHPDVNNQISFKSLNANKQGPATLTQADVDLFTALASSIGKIYQGPDQLLDPKDPKTPMLAAVAGFASTMAQFPIGVAAESYTATPDTRDLMSGNSGVRHYCNKLDQFEYAIFLKRIYKLLRRVGGGPHDAVSQKCKGRCGRECTGDPGWTYFFTRDCFDHDICTDQLGSALCTTELVEAGDDMSEALLRKCSGGSSCALSLSSTAVSIPSQSSRGLNALLYDVRKQLTQTTKGQEYVDLYYKHSAELGGMFLTNPKLALEFGGILLKNSGDLQLLVSNQGDRVMLKAERIDEVRSFFSRLANDSNTDLQQALTGLDQNLFAKIKAGRSARSMMTELGLSAGN